MSEEDKDEIEDKDRVGEFNEEEFISRMKDRIGAALTPPYVLKNNLSTFVLSLMKLIYYLTMPLVFLWALSHFITLSFGWPLYLASFAIVHFFLLN